MNAPLLEFVGIEKAFFGVKVLKGVQFNVPAAGMVGLVGENGAGKSTLMNILGGNASPDAGQIRFDGVAYEPANPKDAAQRGIAFIHQELNLFPNLSIAENIFLARFPTNGPFIDQRLIHRQASDLLREVGLEIPSHRLVESLSSGERQLVEIAKALSIDARLIIFDEPTTSLSARETAHLFDLIARLRCKGIALIYITHTLADVFRLCDEVVVMRDGAVVGSGQITSFTTEKVISLMVGREMNRIFPSRQKQPSSEPLLEVRGITQPGVVTDISFTLHRGEVLGLAGLMGAGRSELARIIFGLDPASCGEVFLENVPLHRMPPRELIELGIAFLTENRRSEGLCLDASVGDNLMLVSLPKHGSTLFRWISESSLGESIRHIRDVVKLDAKTRTSQTVRTLSGGNQQKVVLGKWLLQNPRVLVLDEPTRGIDVGAKFEIYRLILDLADSGAGVFIISSEIEELLGLCDRILVMKKGAIVDTLPKSEFDRERILRAALGTSSTSEAAS